VLVIPALFPPKSKLSILLLFSSPSEYDRAASNSLKKSRGAVKRPEMATEKKLYTLADVAGHNNANDCWLVIDGQVREHHLSFGALSATVFLRRSCLLSPSSAWLRSRCSLLSLEHIFFLLLHCWDLIKSVGRVQQLVTAIHDEGDGLTIL
jgi:hypothetical protein